MFTQAVTFLLGRRHLLGWPGTSIYSTKFTDLVNICRVFSSASTNDLSNRYILRSAQHWHKAPDRECGSIEWVLPGTVRKYQWRTSIPYRLNGPTPKYCTGEDDRELDRSVRLVTLTMTVNLDQPLVPADFCDLCSLVLNTFQLSETCERKKRWFFLLVSSMRAR